MAAKVDRSWLAAVAAAVCIVGFTALLCVVVRSFRLAISDIAESETRVTVVNGDACRLEEVLQNLIANALRYSGTDRIEVASVASRDKVTVTVCDFGIGIAEQHLPHLFERFYRVNKSRSRTLGGTGLGLAIVKHIVRLHGGDVFVSSRPGVKTTFGFTLPIIGDKA